MKYLIASDIHGSAMYLERLAERYGMEEADCLVLLGDLLYHGPRNDLPQGYEPKRCIEILNNWDNILCVRGNCDTEVDQMVLNFPIMAEYGVICLDDRQLYLTHGHRQLPPFKNKPIVLAGHTHVPMAEDRGDYVYVNPGSISLPKENNPHTYAVLDGRKITCKTLDGDIVFVYEF